MQAHFSWLIKCFFCIRHASCLLYHSLVIPCVAKRHTSSYLNLLFPPQNPSLSIPSFLPSLRYYAEYYQQLQQYPQFQYAYPPPSTMAALTGMPGVSAVQAVPTVSAMSGHPAAALDALRPVVPTAAAVAAAMAAPRVYEPPLPPPTRKEAILRRPELSLHTPEPPFR